MMILMLYIGSHLSFDLWVTLKRKNSIFNVISVPKLVEKEVLHYIRGLLCRKLQIQVDQWPPYWILGSESKTSISKIDTYILVNICANCVGFIQKCKIVVIFQAIPPHYYTISNIRVWNKTWIKQMERDLELKKEIKPRSVKYIIYNPKYRYLTGIFCAIFSSIRTAIFT